MPSDQVKSINFLADLVQRNYAEQDALITWLRSREVKAMSSRQRKLHLAILKCETRRAEKEEGFDLAALSIGLRERIQDSMEAGKHTTKHGNIGLSIMFS